ncbi:MAG: valine--tRNA ligase [Candidatus Hydrogenedentota bacterium]
MTTDAEIPTRFDHKAASTKWYAQWEEAGAFRADVDSPKAPFVMVIPPPNVTGALHMGHALNNTIQDIYARYRRMLGFDVLWLPGTDHAGIATQNVVEKMLAKEGVRRDDLGREEFVRRVWKWKEESGGTIVGQLRRLGASCDWSRERFTMDEGLSRAVVEVFVRLHADGLIYRADRLVNWCTRCRTALSDIEVEHEDRNGAFWHVKYPFADGAGFLEIATTRPETMLGDTAVAVHPEDERYRSLVGRDLILPLLGRRIPVIADAYVDREFGTGAVKITPGHDPNDYEVGLRHKLPVIKAFTDDGRIAAGIMEGASSDLRARTYVGKKVLACRDAVVDDLQAEGLLIRVEEIRHSVGHCYRCKTVIEPHLTPQWFVKTGPLAGPAMKAVEEGRTRIVPEQWSKTYFEWMRNIRDWCISRQIWWGHRIPAWYCRACDGANMTSVSTGTNVESRDEAEPMYILSSHATPIVSAARPDRCPRCGSIDLIRDPDVLDTWFSSALWPFSTLGWPDRAPEVSRYYPTSLLVTGFDILFFWVARMMMMGVRFMGDVPFRDVYIHALVRDAEGKKMSKSKGNVIDPLHVIDDHGADAFRFTLAAFCVQGRDIKLDEKRIEGYRNFVTKIWNAARLVLTEPRPASSTIHPSTFSPEDNWIRSRFARCVTEVRRSLDAYELDKASHSIYHFFWHEFCDWYLEIAKPRLREGDPAAGGVAREILESSLRILHPFMPFVTDELAERMGGTSILDRADFPVAGRIFESDEALIEKAISLVTEIRRLRAEFRIAPAEKIPVFLVTSDLPEASRVIIAQLAGVIPEVVAHKAEWHHFASSVASGVEIVIPLEGRIDLEKERARLQEEIRKCEEQIASSRARLGDDNFATNAPADVVSATRSTLLEREDRLRKLRELFANL